MTATAHVDNRMTSGQMVREVAGGVHELVASAAKTATGNSGWLDIGFVDEVMFLAELGACSGTSPTMVLTLSQADSSDGSVGAELLCTSPAANDTSDNMAYKAHVRINKRYVRLVWTIAGTSPSFVLAASLQTGNFKMDKNMSGAWAA
jgi:hypothetical protein